MKIHQIVAEIFQYGPKWWTGQLFYRLTFSTLDPCCYHYSKMRNCSHRKKNVDRKICTLFQVAGTCFCKDTSLLSFSSLLHFKTQQKWNSICLTVLVSIYTKQIHICLYSACMSMCVGKDKMSLMYFSFTAQN